MIQIVRVEKIIPNNESIYSQEDYERFYENDMVYELAKLLKESNFARIEKEKNEDGTKLKLKFIFEDLKSPIEAEEYVNRMSELDI